MRSATSTRSRPVWLCSLQERTSALTFFRACLLIAGLNELNCFPLLARAPRWRNVSPRNVNSVCSYEARRFPSWQYTCLLYTSDAADEEDSVDLGGRRIIKKK